MTYRSLYRRYRSRNFAEIKGQPHVTSALRTAVAEGRQSHAYLFSGPRGTGKTSTARVLAKALNCENLQDGEPCCECKSCTDIEQGTSFDLHELDAASNNKVDDIRDLIAKVALGSPGRTKVYILDEVHMLSSGAENALLKTLEEPPEHVVFVLATTEPHKVVPTIRSRTQHFEFHLLPGDELAEHVRWLVDDAGLDVDEAGIEYALRQGAGSARDTLSALDLVAAAGGAPEGSDVGHLLASAIGDGDSGAAIDAVQQALETGREPRTIGEEALETLRNAFLASMGAPLHHLNEAGRGQAQALAGELGPATITRSLETIGQALVEMRQSPDPRVPLEVALVRLTRRDGDDLAALLQRIESLEQQLAGLAAGSTAVNTPAASLPTDDPRAHAGAAPSPRADAPPSPRGVASSARQKLADRHEATPPSSPIEPPPGARAEPLTETAAEPVPETQPSPSDEDPISLDQLSSAFTGGLLEELTQKVRARFRLGHFTSIDGEVAVFALPNAHVLPRCEEVRADVEAALHRRFGRPLTIRLVVDGDAPLPEATVARSPEAVRSSDPTSSPGGDAAPPVGDTAEEIGDVSQLENASDVASSGVDRLTEAFPGATVIESPD